MLCLGQEGKNLYNRCPFLLQQSAVLSPLLLYRIFSALLCLKIPLSMLCSVIFHVISISGISSHCL